MHKINLIDYFDIEPNLPYNNIDQIRTKQLYLYWVLKFQQYN